MTRLRQISLISFLSGIIILSISFGLNGEWGFTIGIAVPTVIWLLGRWRGWQATYSIALFFLAFFIIIGAYRDNNPSLLLATTLTLFIAWDLEAFAQRLRQFDHIESTSGLVRKHLITIGLIVLLSIILFAVTLGIRLELGIWSAMLLGILLVLGLAQALRYLRESDL